MRSTHPPIVATWLMRHFGCSPNTAPLIGDLIEQWQRGRSRFWYWTQVIQALLSGFFQEIWRHKLLAIPSLLAGWGIKFGWLAFGTYEWRQPNSWIREAYRSPASVNMLVLVTLTLFLAVSSGWLVARVGRPHHRPIVLGYVLLEIFGGLSVFFWTPVLGLVWWCPAFMPLFQFGLAYVGYVGYPSTIAAVWLVTVLVSLCIMIGGGIFSAPAATGKFGDSEQFSSRPLG